MRMRASRFLTVALLGVAAATLVACGGSGKGLIPAQNAGPLQSDFEAIAQAAQTGNGSCSATATAIRTTERDFAALPASVDRGLHGRLESGLSNLRNRALKLCEQPIPPTESTATVSSSSTTESSSTSSTDTQSTETTDTQTVSTNTATATVPPGPGGGTQAPGTEATPGAGNTTPGGQQSPGAAPGNGENGAGAGGAGQ